MPKILALVTILSISLPAVASEQQDALDRFTQSPNTFCDEELAKRFVSANTGANTDGYSLKSDEFEAALAAGKMSQYLNMNVLPAPDDDGRPYEEQLEYFAGRGGWGKSLIPTEEIREAVFIGKVRSRDALSSSFERRCEKVGNSYDSGPLEYDQSRTDGRDREVQAACAELYGPLNRNQCKTSFATINYEMASRSFYSGLRIFEKVLRNSAYDRGLEILAKKMAERAFTKDTQGNLFDDAQTSFIEAGQTAENANEMAWNVVGLLAMAGANTYERINVMLADMAVSVAKYFAINDISNTLPILDHRSAKANGKLYSWPSGVSGSCNTSKSYHFWGAAYLARKAAFASADPRAAAISSFQAAKIYHVMVRPKTQGKSANAASIPGTDISRLNSPAAHIVRIDLAYAAAGAVFGANAAGARSVQINVDQAIAVLLRNEGRGGTLLDTPLRWAGTKLTSEPLLDTYLKWRTNMAPNSPYKFFAKVGFPRTIVPSTATIDQNPSSKVCGK